MKVCPKCKIQNPDNNAFCMQCGTALAPQQAAPNQPYANPNMQGNQSQQKNNLVPILIAVVVIVAIIVAGIVAIVIVKDNNKVETTQPISTIAPTTATTKETTTKETTKKTTKKSTTKATTQPPVVNNYNYYYHDYEGYYYAQDGYLYPSDTQYITYDYLDGISREETRLILNEMYAKHGYIFKEKQYRDYFSAKSWYVPVYNDMNDAQSLFNSIERSNMNTIVEYEKAMGWR